MVKIERDIKSLVLDLPSHWDKKFNRNYFVSNIGKDTAGNRRYDAMDVMFRTQSEHTIDGKQYDLEMQVVHKGHTDANDFSMLSVLFDVTDHSDESHVSEEQVEIIDSFFASMNMSEKENSWEVEEVPLG